MSLFTISARKYRPKLFAQVKGQDHITTTLKNALKDKQLAQAFLFCGPKGTGKTTCARILAKAINCSKLAPTGEPCNVCVRCTTIQQQTSLNIHELDAASYNSVEDIRNLVEQLRYHSPNGKKIFIIDEAHMLSNAAFHGLLKTLEEPPSHVVFILATTEKHKIIPTILSRCQIFDFHRISPSQIASQLQHIAAQEGITCQEAAIQLISHKAEGSLRDALSTFDLVTNFEVGKKLTYSATLRHLNLLDHDYYFRLTNALAMGKVGEALLLYDEIMRASFRGDHFIIGFSEHLRNLLTSQVASTIPLLNPATTPQEAYKKQTEQVGSAFLYNTLQIAHYYGLHYKNVQNKRLHIELMLMQIAQISPAKQIVGTTEKVAKTNVVNPKATNPVTPPSTSMQKTNPAMSPIDTAHDKLKSTTKIPTLDLPKNQITTPLAQVPKNSTNPSHPTNQATPLTQQQILPYWQAYGHKLKQTDPAGWSIMQLPIKVRENTITISLVNPLQTDTVARLRPDLLPYLASALGNSTLLLKSVVQKNEKESMGNTNAEKLQYLTQKYPHVATLQKTLGLEAL